MKTTNQGTVPKGIQTSQTLTTIPKTSNTPKNAKDFINAIVSNDPKAIPKIPAGSKRFLYDQRIQSEAPRNVYRETVHTTEGESIEYLWWHCDNSNYIGRKEVTRINPRTEEKFLLGYDYNIQATKENVLKVAGLGTPRTRYYKKYQQETRTVTKEEFLKSL
jgi:hypothetical protein